jgi:hypothetical protein
VIISNDQRRLERRYQAGRPYIRPRNRHEVSSKEDHIFAILLTFGVGCMLGATLAMGWLSW